MSNFVTLCAVNYCNFIYAHSAAELWDKPNMTNFWNSDLHYIYTERHSVYFYMMDKFNANIYCWKKKKTSKLNLSVLTQDLQWGVMLEGSNQPECVMRLDAKQLPSQSGIFSYKITPWIYGWVTKKKIKNLESWLQFCFCS